MYEEILNNREEILKRAWPVLVMKNDEYLKDKMHVPFLDMEHLTERGRKYDASEGDRTDKQHHRRRSDEQSSGAQKRLLLADALQQDA